MRYNFLSVLAAVALLAACETAPESSGNAQSSGGSSTTSSSSGSSMAAVQIPAGSQEDLVVNVGDRVFFGFDSSDLTAESRAALEKQAAWMKKFGGVRVVLEGHCDERGTREYNLALGERRANAANEQRSQAPAETCVCHRLGNSPRRRLRYIYTSRLKFTWDEMAGTTRHSELSRAWRASFNIASAYRGKRAVVSFAST